jgi:hypothetical protein
MICILLKCKYQTADSTAAMWQHAVLLQNFADSRVRPACSRYFSDDQPLTAGDMKRRNTLLPSTLSTSLSKKAPTPLLLPWPAATAPAVQVDTGAAATTAHKDQPEHSHVSARLRMAFLKVLRSTSCCKHRVPLVERQCWAAHARN